MMTKINGFYNDIEPEIREIVKVLRDNGINTTCSCGHKMYVEADVIPDGTLQVIHKVLFNHLTEQKHNLKYTITIVLEQNIAGLSRCFASIQIGDLDE